MARFTVNKGQTGATCAFFVFAASVPESGSESPPASRFFLTALGFEVGLAGLALLIGWLVGYRPFESVHRDDPLQRQVAALMWGLAAAIPMLATMLLLDRFPIGPLRHLRRFVDTHLVPLFEPLSVCQMVVISLAAGVGEEMLFRGLIQAGLAHWIGPPLGVAIGLLVASVLFGVCHWVTATYAILAGLVGVYLGVLFLLTGNLLAPIVAHAVYDAVALVYLVKYGGREAGGWRP